ncbi:MAG: protein-L-isoaspartate(D-aspartate) O-methyltransferase [Nanoarchaeota archaeon]|nr:protein-L-isoaspartate(D-aspartate) O-methyltransferase [Nanoarchaeota archaeon]MBU1270533.1 protein-L-isoaspartate(D-aspartate) O-methyltransferase [Nanoarchaeota archaeon]MBU1604396.1 protein-L-isoaspartate(D-aspartate) O-methyltransferase [Nanoarchaeota archaeon]
MRIEIKKKCKFKKRIFLILIVVLIGIIFLTNRTSVVEESFIEKNETILVEDKYFEMRKNMIERQLKGRDISDRKVLEVMNKIERHRFVPPSLVNDAYGDFPLPIGHGQTISQPYIVALMTQILELKEDDVVLELGTGSGYQAAVLSEIVKKVYTVEIIQSLADEASDRLKRLGYENVEVKHGDGYFGLEENAPFDAIIVTAAANHIPPPLIKQLKEGGRLVIPLGETFSFQTLTIVTKVEGELKTEFVTGVRFVPLTGEALKE